MLVWFADWPMAAHPFKTVLNEIANPRSKLSILYICSAFSRKSEEDRNEKEEEFGLRHVFYPRNLVSITKNEHISEITWQL